MPFYPDEGNGDDLEIENEYSFDSDDLEKKFEDQSENLAPFKNNQEKSDLGIDQEELKKRIASFSLNKKEEPQTESNSTTEDNPSFATSSDKSSSFVKTLEDKSEVKKALEVEEEDLIEEDEDGVPNIKDNKIKQISELQKKEFSFAETMEDEEDVEFTEEDLKPNKKAKESLLWYIKISRWPVFFITLYSILILVREYLISISCNLTFVAQQIYWLGDFKWLFEILIFILISYIIIRKRKQLPRIAGIAGAMIGFSAGVIIAVIKLFWYREMWNIFYLSAESIFLSVMGLIVCLVTGALFYEEY